MCGVIGFYSPDPRPIHLQTICDLFEQSKIRGLHAAGFSAWQAGKIKTFKHTDVERVKKELMEFRYSPPELLIGHTRYSTSGDWRLPDNNQPIHIEGISMVFNGVISQATKQENEQIHKKIFETDNDGEIFARKVLDGENWAEFVAKGKFSFAGIYLKDNEAYAIRNKNRPLYCARENGGVFFASTKDIFNRAGVHKNVSELPTGEPFRLRSMVC